MAQTRPMREKQYPEIQPKSAMRIDAGTTAEGALANAATPAGRESTPAPTMFLTRLKISLGIVAVPPDDWGFAPPLTLTEGSLGSRAPVAVLYSTVVGLVGNALTFVTTLCVGLLMLLPCWKEAERRGVERAKAEAFFSL